MARAAPGDAAAGHRRPRAVRHQAAGGGHAQRHPWPGDRRRRRGHRHRQRPPGGACPGQRLHAERQPGQRRRDPQRFPRQPVGHQLPEPARAGAEPGCGQRRHLQRRAAAELRELRPAAGCGQRPADAGRQADRWPGGDHAGVAGRGRRPGHHPGHPGPDRHPGRRRQRHRHRQRRPERRRRHPGQPAGGRQCRAVRAVDRHHLRRALPQPDPGRGAVGGGQHRRRHGGQPGAAAERQDPVGQPHRPCVGAGHGEQCVDQQQHPPAGHPAGHLLDPGRRHAAGPGTGRALGPAARRHRLRLHRRRGRQPGQRGGSAGSSRQRRHLCRHQRGRRAAGQPSRRQRLHRVAGARLRQGGRHHRQPAGGLHPVPAERTGQRGVGLADRRQRRQLQPHGAGRRHAADHRPGAARPDGRRVAGGPGQPVPGPVRAGAGRPGQRPAGQRRGAAPRRAGHRLPGDRLPADGPADAVWHRRAAVRKRHRRPRDHQHRQAAVRDRHVGRSGQPATVHRRPGPADDHRHRPPGAAGGAGQPDADAVLPRHRRAGVELGRSRIDAGHQRQSDCGRRGHRAAAGLRQQRQQAGGHAPGHHRHPVAGRPGLGLLPVPQRHAQHHRHRRRLPGGDRLQQPGLGAAVRALQLGGRGRNLHRAAGQRGVQHRRPGHRPGVPPVPGREPRHQARHAAVQTQEPRQPVGGDRRPVRRPEAAGGLRMGNGRLCAAAHRAAVSGRQRQPDHHAQQRPAAPDLAARLPAHQRRSRCRLVPGRERQHGDWRRLPASHRRHQRAGLQGRRRQPHAGIGGQQPVDRGRQRAAVCRRHRPADHGAVQRLGGGDHPRAGRHRPGAGVPGRPGPEDHPPDAQPPVRRHRPERRAAGVLRQQRPGSADRRPATCAAGGRQRQPARHRPVRHHAQCQGHDRGAAPAAGGGHAAVPDGAQRARWRHRRAAGQHQQGRRHADLGRHHADRPAADHHRLHRAGAPGDQHRRLCGPAGRQQHQRRNSRGPARRRRRRQLRDRCRQQRHPGAGPGRERQLPRGQRVQRRHGPRHKHAEPADCAADAGRRSRHRPVGARRLGRHRRQHRRADRPDAGRPEPGGHRLHPLGAAPDPAGQRRQQLQRGLDHQRQHGVGAQPGRGRQLQRGLGQRQCHGGAGARPAGPGRCRRQRHPAGQQRRRRRGPGGHPGQQQPERLRHGWRRPVLPALRGAGSAPGQRRRHAGGVRHPHWHHHRGAGQRRRPGQPARGQRHHHVRRRPGRRQLPRRLLCRRRDTDVREPRRRAADIAGPGRQRPLPHRAGRHRQFYHQRGRQRPRRRPGRQHAGRGRHRPQRQLLLPAQRDHGGAGRRQHGHRAGQLRQPDQRRRDGVRPRRRRQLRAGRQQRRADGLWRRGQRLIPGRADLPVAARCAGRPGARGPHPHHPDHARLAEQRHQLCRQPVRRHRRRQLHRPPQPRQPADVRRGRQRHLQGARLRGGRPQRPEGADHQRQRRPGRRHHQLHRECAGAGGRRRRLRHPDHRRHRVRRRLRGDRPRCLRRGPGGGVRGHREGAGRRAGRQRPLLHRRHQR